jgi:hypothetical protein
MSQAIWLPIGVLGMGAVATHPLPQRVVPLPQVKPHCPDTPPPPQVVIPVQAEIWLQVPSDRHRAGVQASTGWQAEVDRQTPLMHSAGVQASTRWQAVVALQTPFTHLAGVQASTGVQIDALLQTPSMQDAGVQASAVSQRSPQAPQ